MNISVGDKFGKLTVVEDLGLVEKVGAGRIRRRRTWRCRCECGSVKSVQAYNLISGNSKSCRSCQHKTHGMAGTLTCKSYYAMMARCYNQKHPKFHNYGGKGIGACEHIKSSPCALIDTIGPRPDRRHTLDRILNSIGYCCGKCDDCLSKKNPLNIQWSDATTQNRNRRQVHKVEIGGIVLPLMEWADTFGINRNTNVLQIQKWMAWNRSFENNSENMTSLLQQIEDLIPKLHGWCSPYRASVLASHVIAIRPQVSLLIGVWGGRDTFALALAHKAIGFGKVIAIDPWEASASVVGQGDADRKWWAESGEDPNGLKPGHHESVYQDFVSRIVPLGLQDYIEVIRKRSDDVEPPSVIDIAVVDGNHGVQAITDAKRFVSKVRVGGLCYMDDLDWGAGAVREAENYILSIGFVQLYKLDTGAVYQRMGVL